MESMSPDPVNDEAQLREELVAYLDGELDGEQSRRIEQRAAAEPEARRMLQELDRAWHMLDELDYRPPAKTSPAPPWRWWPWPPPRIPRRPRPRRRGGACGPGCGSRQGWPAQRRPVS